MITILNVTPKIVNMQEHINNVANDPQSSEN